MSDWCQFWDTIVLFKQYNSGNFVMLGERTKRPDFHYPNSKLRTPMKTQSIPAAGQIVIAKVQSGKRQVRATILSKARQIPGADEGVLWAWASVRGVLCDVEIWFESDGKRIVTATDHCYEEFSAATIKRNAKKFGVEFNAEYL